MLFQNGSSLDGIFSSSDINQMTIPKVLETSIFPTGQSCKATAVPAYTIPNYNCQHVNTIVSGFSGHSKDQPNSKLLNHVCCALVNFQSIQTKSHQVKDYIIDHDIDIFFITETWVYDNLRDSLILSAATPPGYAYLSFPRLNRRGGGIAVFHNKCLKINLLKEHHSDACEAIELAVKLGSNQLNVVIVYRAPSLSFRLFLDLMRDIFGRLVTSSQRRLLCVGDFNIHMDNEHDHKTKSFKSMLDEFGLKQHVNVPTHKFGHVLDLVISDQSYPNLLLENGPVLEGYVESDHFPLCFHISWMKPSKPTKSIKYRRWKTLDKETFKADLKAACSTYDLTCGTNALVEFYNKTLNATLERHVPLKEKVVTEHANCPYYNDIIRSCKTERRRLERRWRRTKDPDDRQNYVSVCREMNDLLLMAKADYYKSKLAACGKDHKAIFKVINELLHRNTGEIFPDVTGVQSDLPQKISNFFTDKIDLIRHKLDSYSVDMPGLSSVKFQSFLDVYSKSDQLSCFCALSDAAVDKLIVSRPTKHSQLDPIPTWLLKENSKELLPLISKIINSSLMSGIFPSDFKCAILVPLLKKYNLDPMIFNNLRPISNLAFMSKLIESAVCNQYKAHLKRQGLAELYQSAYKENHSVETALICVQNDIVCALDDKKSVLLVLLDLSAAFDTVDHNALMNVLEKRVGVTGLALEWFTSYLSNRSQCVAINGVYSQEANLKCGVPQGSVLGPVLFTTYMLPLGDILRHLHVKFHCYADDQQIYIEFFIGESVSEKIEECLAYIFHWMRTNFVMCNTDKTEMIVFSPSRGPTPQSIHLKCGYDVISPVKEVVNLGVIFDEKMKLESHVNKICQTAYLHLKNISRIRKSLDVQNCETLIHAFVTSRLDCQNALLYGLPDYLLDKLQRVQNAAARLLCGIGKYDHISPTLKSLHWLPVKQRIEFKISVLVYKCLNGLAPQYLCKLLHFYAKDRDLRSADDKTLLEMPQSRTKFGERAFCYYAPKIWNSLPKDIRSSKSIDTFKKKVKTHLFSLAYHGKWLLKLII